MIRILATLAIVAPSAVLAAFERLLCRAVEFASCECWRATRRHHAFALWRWRGLKREWGQLEERMSRWLR